MEVGCSKEVMANRVENGPKFRLLLAASEVVTFAKTGGLADVAGSLPRALARRGHECAVILPLYSCVRSGRIPLQRTDLQFTVPIGPRKVMGTIWRAQLPDSAVPVYLIEQAAYFERDNPAQGRGLYQLNLPTGQKGDYPDNCERFVFFARAVLEAIRLLNYWPEVLHLNDWQTGLAPVYLKEEYQRRLAPNLREKYGRIRTLFTIHNIAYQGLFWHLDMPLTGLDWRLFNYRHLEFYGKINFLKAGIVFSDAITTVSPTYAREIQTPYYGCGLEGVLTERRDRLAGIVNGVDYAVWSPASDPHLATNYDVNTVAEKKPICKAALQRRFRLLENPKIPLLGIVSRLVEQKGVQLIGRTADFWLNRTRRDDPDSEAQLVVLGEGDPAYHRMFVDLQARHPSRVGLYLGFDEALAHQIEAGADIFLMPSEYEPSGLNQLYSLKYGTVPVVRATGGLADTIVDASGANLSEGRATGFTFLANNPATFLITVQQALETYRRHPETWLQLMKTGMQQDWSWDRSAAEYERLFAKIASRL
jgi:starch synthase